MIATACQPAFIAHAPEFDEVTGDCPGLSLLALVDAHEGPVYFPGENALYFTTLPRSGADRTPSVQVKRLALEAPGEVSVLVAEANGANGMAPDREDPVLHRSAVRSARRVRRPRQGDAVQRCVRRARRRDQAGDR